MNSSKSDLTPIFIGKFLAQHSLIQRRTYISSVTACNQVQLLEIEFERQSAAVTLQACNELLKWSIKISPGSQPFRISKKGSRLDGRLHCKVTRHWDVGALFGKVTCWRSETTSVVRITCMLTWTCIVAVHARGMQSTAADAGWKSSRVRLEEIHRKKGYIRRRI